MERTDAQLRGLCLSRGVDQSVQIGTDIVVQVIGVRGRVVRLKIVAPKTVRVLRTELESEGNGNG